MNRVFVCERCKATFEPPPDELEALAELESLGLPQDRCSMLCEECAKAGEDQ
jgi:hypothetical protein